MAVDCAGARRYSRSRLTPQELCYWGPRMKFAAQTLSSLNSDAQDLFEAYDPLFAILVRSMSCSSWYSSSIKGRFDS